MKKYLILSLLIILANSHIAQVATCSSTQGSYDANNNYRDIIYIEGDANGKRDNLSFSNIIGSNSNSDGYTIIINKNNIPVVIDGEPDGGYNFCIRFINCTNFVLTSSTTTSDPYGIKLYAIRDNGTTYANGITFDGRCFNYIIENIEIYNDPDAALDGDNDNVGIYINDPHPYYHVNNVQCNSQNMFVRWGNYIDLTTNTFTEGYFIENVIIRNNKIYNMGKEGMYIGYSSPYEYEILTCGGTDYKIFWPELKNIQVYSNTIENTGATGIKISNDSLGIFVHDNIIKNYGLKDGGNNAGIWIGGGTYQASFYNNWIENGTGEGIGSKGAYYIDIFNNIIKDAGSVPNTDNGHGIYINWLQSTPIYTDDRGYRIYNNTIVNPEEDGIFVEHSWFSGKKIYNNIIVYDSSNDAIDISGQGDWTIFDNYHTTTISTVVFVDHVNSNYNLSIYSPCIDNAYNIGLDFDYNNNFRPSCYGTDKGALESKILRWEYQTTGAPHTIVIGPTSSISKVDLSTNQQTDIEQGDVIGVFYSDSEGNMACGGYATWDLTNGATVIAYGESIAGEDDGFVNGETMTWVIHDADENVEYSAWPIDDNNSVIDYSANSSSTLVKLKSACQEIELEKTWDLISTYIDPLCPEIEYVLKDIEPYVNEVQRYDNGVPDIKYYKPEIENDINDIQIGEGFKISMNNLNQTLTLYGAKVPYYHDITLESTKDYFGYLKYNEAEIENMLSDVVSDIMYVKDDDVFIYFSGILNTIEWMKPGEGYYCHLLSSQNITLNYPSGTKSHSLPMEKSEVAYYTDYYKTYNTMGLGLMLDSWDNMPENGDEIGVFDSQGMLCGAAVYENNNMVFLVHGDDKSTNIKEGLLENEEFTIRVYNSFSGIEREFEVAEWIEGSEKYEDDGISIAGKMQEIVPESIVFCKIFPNPCKDSFTVNFYLPTKESIKVDLFDMFGSKVDNIISKELTKGYHSYNYQISSLSKGTYFVKLSSESFNATKKIILM